jgi:hypothetical protein
VPMAGIDVRLDGEAMRVPVDIERPDVGAFLGRKDARHGWSATVTAAVGTLPGQSMISLTAVADDGTEMPFHLGTVEGTELARRLRGEDHARHQHEALIERLRASEADLSRELALIKAGRYWKLREAWCNLKRGRQSSR